MCDTERDRFTGTIGACNHIEAEQAAFDRGEINIAYGSDEREEKVFYRVLWIEGDIAYSIYTFDPGSLTMDDFFQMAQEVIEA